MPGLSPGTHEEDANARVGGMLSGKWHLDRLLGVGGMAAVYEATHRNGSRAAIKVFRPGILADARLRERFLREGYLANKVAHPGAVRVFDDHEDALGESYLVMELVLGETLQQRFEHHGPIPPRELLAILDKLLDVLDAAHSRGIVHRDLKPDNVVVTPAGDVRVLDFGIARGADGPSSPTRTLHGTAVGTPAYMPPEQALGRTESVGPRSDLYALGAMSFYLACGEFAHDALTAEELVVKAATSAARPLREAWEDAPPELARVIDRACRFEVDDRYASAEEMRADVRKALGGDLDAEPADPGAIGLTTTRTPAPMTPQNVVTHITPPSPRVSHRAISTPRVTVIPPISQREETTTLASGGVQTNRVEPADPRARKRWVIAFVACVATAAVTTAMIVTGGRRSTETSPDMRVLRSAPMPARAEVSAVPEVVMSATAPAIAPTGPAIVAPSASAAKAVSAATSVRASRSAVPVSAPTIAPVAQPATAAPTVAPTARDVGY